MTDDTVRLTCARENCGTFVMDVALHEKLKRTGQTFTCPAGHEQHFSETVEKKLRGRIEELERKVDRLKEDRDRLKDRTHERWLDYRDEKRLRKDIEAALLDRADGVVEIGDSWMWGCSCGSRGQSQFDTEEEAGQAFGRHLRQRCDEHEATNGGTA